MAWLYQCKAGNYTITIPRGLNLSEGLFAFADTRGVLNAIEELQKDYLRHTRAARRIAEEFFDSAKVLRRLLELAGI